MSTATTILQRTAPENEAAMAVSATVILQQLLFVFCPLDLQLDQPENGRWHIAVGVSLYREYVRLLICNSTQYYS
jgi:hypothetical protein